MVNKTSLLTWRKKLWFTLLVICITLSFFVLLGGEVSNIPIPPRRLNNRTRNGFRHANATVTKTYTVNSPSCSIPDLDPFHPYLKDILLPGQILNCRDRDYETFTFETQTSIHVNWTSVRRSRFKNTFSFCRYIPIIRPLNKGDWEYSYLRASPPFNESIRVQHEFVTVVCYAKKVPVYLNYHQFAQVKPVVVERCRQNRLRSQKINGKENLNVLMVGIDSMSRLNSMRHLPKTRKYLKQQLDAIEFTGYNKVGENTFVNFIPILCGKFLEELPRHEEVEWMHLDSYNFIWKKFSENGYMTLLAEDAPHIGGFNYMKAGFNKTPTDYYYRHFALALGHPDDSPVWNRDNCIHNRLETDFALTYAYNFMVTSAKSLHFGFVFTTGLSHDAIEESAISDEPHQQFLKKLNDNGLLNNTVLIFYSDHGIRFGKIRETFIGKMEENLPMLFFVLPKWFSMKYPNIRKNLEINSKRLTTPFDMHETLEELLHFENKTTKRNKHYKKRGYSLFSSVPFDRSCGDAEIPMHYCSCIRETPVSVREPEVIQAAKALVDKINSLLKKYKDRCENLKLVSITNALKQNVSDGALRFVTKKYQKIKKYSKYMTGYQVTVQTHPGNAIFEGTIIYIKVLNQSLLLDDISRLNKYGQQSYCVKVLSLKKYCYCNDYAGVDNTTARVSAMS